MQMLAKNLNCRGQFPWYANVRISPERSEEKSFFLSSFSSTKHLQSAQKVKKRKERDVITKNVQNLCFWLTDRIQFPQNPPIKI